MTAHTAATRRDTLAALLGELVTADPDAAATLDVVDGEPIVTSRAELRARVDALTSELVGVGVRRGQCVAVLLPNWSDAIVWQLAASAVGAHVIGVNTRYNTHEIAHILTSARPAVVAVADHFHGLDLFGRLDEAQRSLDVPAPAVAVVRGPGTTGAAPDPARFDLGGGAWTAGSTDTGTVQAPETPDMATTTAAGERAAPDDVLAVAFTTSGSTGVPKLAAHRESAVVRHARADAVVLGVEPGDVTLCVLPVSGVFGYSTALATLAGGGALLMEPVFDAADTLARMASLKVTHVVGGDDLFARLYDTWHGGDRADLSSLKRLGIADFLGRSHEVAAWVRDEFDAVTTGVFGSSEVFALMLLWDAADPESLRWNGGGRPVEPGIEVRIVDPLDDSALPDGEQGELQVRGPNVVDAYLGNPDAAARAFTRDGWFRSGDLAVATGDGGYTYVCRMGDVLRLRGFLVDPAEIEHRLAEHEAVHLTKVVGITGTGGYTEAVAFVVPTEGTSADAADLKAWCAESLAAFKVPAAVHMIEQMPTTVGGNGTKIRAVELREWAQRWTDHERDFRSA
ncbi:AMP-binding protein [Rhodococcus opacus]|uniref:Long-chain-fatty-acid--CoA ligase n=1 Tax=Rhodococcus opacus TaxID=37919 RepID=A0A076EZ80_RHOOP|nr:AMP-binding protein [Rhodococcus opacus]AII08649.1 acyl-CoA synthetase [Rhodococcus opacus]